MSIKTTWQKYSSQGTFQKYKVYRSSDRATVFNAANLITEITDQNVVEYIDLTAPNDATVFYGIGVLTDLGEVKSAVQPGFGTAYPGPGGMTLLGGNWNNGYLGAVDDNMSLLPDMMVEDYINSVTGFSPVRPANPYLYGKTAAMHKFMLNGRLIFTPGIYNTRYNATTTIKTVWDNFLQPFLAVDRFVTIEGQRYKFGVMTYEEVKKIRFAMLRLAQSNAKVYVPTLSSFNANNSGFLFNNDASSNVIYGLLNNTGGVGEYLKTSAVSNLAMTSAALCWYIQPVPNI